MANNQREEAKERLWREVIGRHGSSGLSVREFCRREGLKEASFFAWRRTIAERAGGATPSFVPVVVNDPPKRGASLAIELTFGRVLRLPALTPAAWVAELVLALESKAGR